jgi:hypothetical protein
MRSPLAAAAGVALGMLAAEEEATVAPNTSFLVPRALVGVTID